MKTLSGRVVKAVASKFFVDTLGGVKVCFARKKLKQDGGDIYVGDYVEIAKDRDTFVIESVQPRKNVLIRPYVSNVDMCFIVVAPEPEPDFVLVDKIIINCLEQHIEPVLVKNKTDLAKLDTAEYNKVCKQVNCCAEDGSGLNGLIELARGKTVCLAGQSAVGKSSIINAVSDAEILEVGEMAKKIKRGRHTTRRTEIIALSNGACFVDTCGFSMLETIGIEPEELRLYYDDFEIFRKQCRFNSCTHTDEPDCAVKLHVGTEIGVGRYERYKAILNELEMRRKNKYD
jgi:ribosome biogenesis GTPase